MKKFILKLSLILLFITTLYVTYSSLFVVEDSFLKSITDNIFTLNITGLLFLFLMFYSLIKIFDYFKIWNKKYFNIIIFLIIISLQIVFLVNLKYLPITDSSTIHEGALEILNTNKVTENVFFKYFTRYSNQLPLVVLQGNIYKFVNFLGSDDYFLALRVINIILINLSILLGMKILRKFKSENLDKKFLLFSLFNPINYLFLLYFYTSTIVIPIILAMILVYIYFIEAKSFNEKCFYIILLSLLTVAGFVIRVTSFITIIAIIIFHYLNSKKGKNNKKKAIIYSLIVVIVSSVTYLGINSYINSYKDFDATNTSFPITHWIMMGLHGDGTYSGDDVSYTQSFDTKEEKIIGNLRKIKQRMLDMSISDYLNLSQSKLDVLWATGTIKSDYLFQQALEFNTLYNYTIGSKKMVFTFYSLIYRILMLLFIVIEVYRYNKKKQLDYEYILLLTLLGNIIFYLIWEANQIYSITLVPIMVLLLTISFDKFVTKKIVNKKILKALFLILISLTIVLSVKYYSKITDKNLNNIDYSINIVGNSTNYLTRVTKDDEIIQTFETNKSFNTISINMKNPRNVKDVSYLFELYDSNNKLLYSKEFLSDEVKKGGNYLKFNFDTILNDKQNSYYYKITSSNATYDESINILAYIGYYDKLPNGNCTRNNEDMKGDIVFKVYEEKIDRYISKSTYLVMTLIIVTLEFSTYKYFYRKKRS